MDGHDLGRNTLTEADFHSAYPSKKYASVLDRWDVSENWNEDKNHHL